MTDHNEAASSIVGTWELLSMSWNYPDGRITEPWGRPPGRITYDADGNMMAMLMHERRNQADGGSQADQNSADSYSAYFGTYRIDAAQGLVLHQVTGSLNGRNASGELVRTFRFEGGLLNLAFTVAHDGVPITRRLVWKKASRASN